ncbi:Leucine Rich repeats (2 copies) [Symmachiella macrocystis]|uniref:Leucine Rich repeats (2 copies) n=2 Tax=Symmachiella macrocystis TaxID=2527985 RepID=A0A5C6BPX1_9PLAN|nr:Leucine Rich repeats (2 copies) [Symmachiella macrocystis]
MTRDDANQADLIASLAKDLIEVVPDPEYGGMLVRSGGPGINVRCPEIGRLEGVTSIELMGTDIDDEGFPYLCHHHGLRKLRYNASHVTAKGLAHAKAWQQLTEVKIQCLPVKGLLDAFAALPQLEILSAIGCELNEHDLECLANCRRLRKLYLSNNPIRCGFRYAANCPQLEFLEAADTELDMEGMQEIAQLNSLRNLSFSHTPIDHDICMEIGSLTRLTRLSLGHTGVPASAATVLNQLPDLTELWWPSTGITMENIQDFASLKNLKELEVPGRPAPAPEIVKALRAALPHCDVNIWWPDAS